MSVETVGATKVIPRVQNLPAYKTYLVYRQDPLGFFEKLAREYGDILSFQMGPLPVVLINSPELIHSLLVEHAADFDKSKIQRDLFKPIAGEGLFTSEGKLHQQQRKLMAPVFQPRRLSQYAATMVDFANRNQAAWKEGDSLDLGSEMMRLTMSIVSKVMLNIEVNDASNELGRAIEAANQWNKYSTTALFPLPLWFPTRRSLYTKKQLAILRTRIQAIIEERRQNSEDQGDLLSMLLTARDEAGQGMSDRQIFDETATIFLAGHETTARALTWTFYLLAQHPEVYSRVRAEVDTVLQGRLPTYTDLAKLPYTLQVFKEAMRIYPPSSVIFRGALRNTDLNGYPIRRGTLVMFSQYVLHRRPDLYPLPESFNPERFTLENEQKLPRHAYIPFGVGHRICIGNHFATMEGHLLLATLSQKIIFEEVSAAPVKPELVVTLRPKETLWMRVHCRN